jgi:hypothetical protein
MVAGQVIPTMVTATAAIASSNSLEFIKLTRAVPLASYRNACFNLNVPSTWQLFEPLPVRPFERTWDSVEMAEVEPLPAGLTMWDRLIIDRGDLTVQELLDCFPALYHGAVPAFICFGRPSMAIIYCDFSPPKMRQRLEGHRHMKMTDVYLAYHPELPDLPATGFFNLEMSVMLNDAPVRIPRCVRFVFDRAAPHKYQQRSRLFDRLLDQWSWCI